MSESQTPSQDPPESTTSGATSGEPEFTLEQKLAAQRAGLIALPLISVGAVLVLSTARRLGPIVRSIATDGLDDSAWNIVLAVVGILLVWLGWRLSNRRLQAAAVGTPRDVTASALGVSLPVLMVLGFAGGTAALAILWTIDTRVGEAMRAGGGESDDAVWLLVTIATAVVGFAVWITVTGFVGRFIWAWRARAIHSRRIRNAGAPDKTDRDE